MALAAAAGVLFLVGAYVLYQRSLSRRIETRLSAVRAAGYPVTLAELDEWYERPPAGENAAELYMEAFSLYVRDAKLEKDARIGAPPRGAEPLSAEIMTAAVKLLEKNERALELLHKGASMDRCRYPLDMGAGLEAAFSHMAPVRRGVRLLGLEAVVHAENGETELATRSVISSLSLARSLAREPFLFSQIGRIVYEGIALNRLERVLARARLTDAQLVRIVTALADEEDLNTMERALAGERCLVCSFFTMEESERVQVFPDVDARPYKSRGLGAGNYLDYLDTVERYARAARMPYPERIEAVKAAPAREEPPLRLFGDADMLDFDRAMKRYVVHDGEMIALARAAITSLALERCRLAEGKLPAKLADLVPQYLDAVAEDPFDGKPLRYRRREKGYVVYSIGKDGIDGGGEGREAWKDVRFTVER